jgi:acetyltransferase-like isoleucine patch superfamily enzyme
MMDDEKQVDGNPSEKKEVKLPALDFVKINIISFVVPFYACLGFFLLFEYLMSLLKVPFFFQLALIPMVFFGLYYLYIIILIEFVAFWVRYWNRKSPPQQGVFERILDDFSRKEAKLIKYYHKRGFIIKFPMWISSKSFFPWLINRVLRRIGHNHIGNNVIYTDCYVGLEFTDISNDVFMYPTTALSSHEVNSIFGKITMLEIKLGKNVTLYPGIIVGPAAVVNDNSVIFPNTVLHKNWRGKPERYYYQGSPGKPIEINHIK